MAVAYETLFGFPIFTLQLECYTDHQVPYLSILSF